MSTTRSASTQPALFAGRDYANRMPSSTHSMSMATAPGVIIIGTGVLASVSLFVLPHLVASLLLISLVLLISLILSGLTGLSGLVRLTIGLEL